jgi:hypothetical protein
MNDSTNSSGSYNSMQSKNSSSLSGFLTFYVLKETKRLYLAITNEIPVTSFLNLSINHTSVIGLYVL